MLRPETEQESTHSITINRNVPHFSLTCALPHVVVLCYKVNHHCEHNEMNEQTPPCDTLTVVVACPQHS